MSFLNTLRMRNIFPRHGESPLGMPDTGSSDMGFNEVMPVLRSLENERNNKVWSDRAAEQTLNPQPRTDGMKQVGNEINKPPQNVVLADQMNPYQEASLGLKEKQLKQQGELGRGRLEGQAADRNVRQQRANVYEFKAQNPGLKIQATRGGNYVAINPITGETKDLGIPTGTLSREEELELMGDNQMEAVNARIAGQHENTRMTNEARLKQIGATIQGQREVANIRTSREIPSQANTRRQMAANELRNKKPEWAKWIKTGPDGSIEISPATRPGRVYGNYAGPTEKERQEMINIIYGPSQVTAPTTNTTPTTNPNMDPAARAAELIKKHTTGKK